jgi:hypothetical protein
MPFLAGVVTPQDYGAQGDGVTDDTAAINLAIQAVAASGGGILFFPAGTYQVTPTSSTTAALVLNNGSTGYYGVRLMGTGENAAILRRTAAGPIISMSGPATDTTGVTHCRYCTLESLELHGNNLTGTLFQTYYADNLAFHDCHFTNSLDVGQDCAEFWDSRYYNCLWDSSGSTTANTTAPNLWLRNSAATSGFGYSSSTVNNVYFFGCRWEQFTTGAIRVERGLGSNVGQPYSLYFVSGKIETSLVNGGSAVFVDTTARDVHFDNFHAYQGGFYSGYSTAQDVFTFGPQFGSIKNTLIFNSTAVACIANGVTLNAPLANSYVIAESVRGSYTGGATPTGAHVAFGTSTGEFRVMDCQADNGTQFSGEQTNATEVNLTSGTAAGTFGINNSTAVSGNTNADVVLVEATTASNALGLRVTGDTLHRYLLNAKGDGLYSGGTTADYTSLRAAPGVHGFTKSLLVGSGTDLGDNGVGELKIANATTVPTTNPTGGALAYASAGVVNTRNPQGLVQTIGGLVQSQITTVTVANATTNVLTSLQSFTVPANDVAAGTIYEMTGFGIFSNNGTPTLNFTMLWGGVAGTVLTTIPTAITLPNSLTNSPFFYEVIVNFRSTTTAWTTMNLSIDTSTSLDTAATYITVPATVTTITTTGANALTMAVTWNPGSASNTISLVGGKVERTA